MKIEQGRLIDGHWYEVPVEYVPRGEWFNGTPSYFELFDLNERLPVGQNIELRRPDGQIYVCRVLDSCSSGAVLALL
jgi:hypothetical protein